MSQPFDFSAVRSASLLSALVLAFAAGTFPTTKAAASPVERKGRPAVETMDFAIKNMAARHRSARVRASMHGEGGGRYYIFEPSNPTPPEAPVVLFNHGWAGMNPLNFGNWIEHIVRQGIVVIYPVYQTDAATPPRLVTDNAITAFRDAMKVLESGGHVRPDRNRVAAAGFSMGATISANIAARAANEGLPKIRAVLAANPGNAQHVAKGPEAASIIGDMSGVPSDTVVFLVVGADDSLTKDGTATQIASGLCHLPAAARRIFEFHSSTSGASTAKAGHGAPGAPDKRYDFGDDGGRFVSRLPAGRWPAPSSSLNNLDVFGYWKLMDDLIDSALLGKPVQPATGRGLFMGYWPDGKEFDRANELDDPCVGR